jgi:NAD-dependent deacetylase
MTSHAASRGAVALARDAQRVAILTGAGMSAESGVPTFRDVRTGLWARFDNEELASADGWERDSALVWGWYRWRMDIVARAQPNPGHRAITEWQRAVDVTVATQNVDDLHERAGTTVAAHVHGNLFDPRCYTCGRRDPDFELAPFDPSADRMTPPTCPHCGGEMRPGVVWFGESLPSEDWNAASAAVSAADLVVVIGTSGVVQPFASLPSHARGSVLEINPVETEISHVTDVCWRTTAAEGLPALVDAVLRPGTL